MSPKFGQMRPLVSMATDRVSGKNGVITFSPTFLIGFISYLQVMMIYIRACMSSKFGEIRPWTTELAALERLKKSHRLIMEKMTSSHFLRYFSSDPFHTCRQ